VRREGKSADGGTRTGLVCFNFIALCVEAFANRGAPGREPSVGAWKQQCFEGWVIGSRGARSRYCYGAGEVEAHCTGIAYLRGGVGCKRREGKWSARRGGHRHNKVERGNVPYVPKNRKFLENNRTEICMLGEMSESRGSPSSKKNLPRGTNQQLEERAPRSTSYNAILPKRTVAKRLGKLNAQSREVQLGIEKRSKGE